MELQTVEIVHAAISAQDAQRRRITI